MPNKNSFLKSFVILTLCLLGALYALPNIYAPDHALQINGYDGRLENVDLVERKVNTALENAGIETIRMEQTDAGILVRLNSADTQLRAKEVISEALGREFVVAMNLADTTPQWLVDLGASPMTLGLDLSGGVHFLLQVDTAQAVQNSLESRESEVRTQLRENRIRYSNVATENGRLSVVLRDMAKVAETTSLLRTTYPDLDIEVSETDVLAINISFSDAKVRELEDYAVQQNLTSLRNRVNELGVAEPIVQRQGRSRIVVQLPGVQDAAQAKRIIGKTANLQFHLESNSSTPSYLRETLPNRDNPNLTAVIDRTPIVTGDQVTNAQPTFDPQTSTPQVSITLDGAGGTQINRATRDNVGRRMAVQFIEYKTRFRTVTTESGETVEEPYQEAERSWISLATINSPLSNRFVITGISPVEARELSLLLRAGALAAPVYFEEERTIGPSLGAENIAKGIDSIKIGLGLVVIFMILYYRVFGVIANVALTVNLVLMVAVMSVLGATLTMPGIAGMVLTVGMAVDANVLIFARIREELRNGKNPQVAINSGYERAFNTIFDANITTFLVAVILYAVGTGPVQGFAVTLMVGIVTSMFTAILLTRLIVNAIYGGRRVSKLMI
jgi:preprotein translocase subunit SecD